MTYLTPERVDAARREIRSQSNEDIELKTAINWACRAIAAAEQHSLTGDMSWLVRAVGYANEAVEHAASAGVGMADQIRAELATTLDRYMNAQ